MGEGCLCKVAVVASGRKAELFASLKKSVFDSTSSLPKAILEMAKKGIIPN